MADVFISYSHADKAAARELAAYLDAQGYSVWWDSNLEGGEDLQLEIHKEIWQARAVIVLWSKASAKSTWVRAEAAIAVQGQKLIPVKLPDTGYEDIVPPFSQYLALEFTNKEIIEAALQSKLAEQPSNALLWKRLRFELLSWIGVIGASITFAAHLQGLVKLSRFSVYIVKTWTDLLYVFWKNVLFFLPSLAKNDAIIFSIILFTAHTLFMSPAVEVSKVRRPWISDEVRVALLFSFLVLVFSLGIYLSIDQQGVIYHWAAASAGIFGLDIEVLDRLHKSLIVALFVMVAIGIALLVIIAGYAIARKQIPASHEASVPAVSSRLNRIVVGVIALVILSELAGKIEEWVSIIDQPGRI
ncbi:MAG: toll/interleukin-1 receptor domain-containing protein [Rhodomicrobium sp.]